LKKIHLGSGTNYLYGYINVDANPLLLSSNPVAKQMIEENGTTFENYYKTDFNNRPKTVVSDVKAKVEDLPFEDGFADEIVMFHVLEHIPYYRQKMALNEISRILKSEGKFIVAVPDTIKTAELLVNAKTEEEEAWAIRLLYGTQRNEFSHHFIGFTRNSLIKTLSNYGFVKFEDRENINFYPAIHLTATKQ
jgi:ubiquinone/menaquinone biosynthesis C-methylase UbiE